MAVFDVWYIVAKFLSFSPFILCDFVNVYKTRLVYAFIVVRLELPVWLRGVQRGSC